MALPFFKRSTPTVVMCHRPGTRSLADNQIKLKILHGWIQNFFHCMVQAVDFINKKNITFLQTGQYGGKIALLFNNGTGGYFYPRPHFIGDNIGECRFAETGKTMKKRMIERFTTTKSCLNKDGKAFS